MSSINLALSSALSGLLTSQQALSVVSNNLANVNNPNYSAKSVTEQGRVLSGVGAGVQIASITRSVDEGLNKTVRTATGDLNDLTTSGTYYTQLQNLFGQPSDASSISSLIQNMQSAFSTLATSPNSDPSSAVQAATQAVNSLQSMTTQIQSLRSQSDQQMGADVATINTTLQNIANLNNQISTVTATGTSPADLEDQRDTQLNTLSGYMNFTSFTRPDGSISIYTTGGTPLLDGTTTTLAHTDSNIVDPQMTSAGGNLSGITANGIDITSQLTSGTLSALVDMRDNVLPNLQSQLDTLAQSTMTTLNQVNNRGTSYPSGGQSLTGATTFTSPNTQTMSLSGGDTAIVLMDGTGNETASTTVNTLMQKYMQSVGQPTTSAFTPTQLASATNSWLNTQFNTSGITYASVTSAGNFSIQLPQSSSTTIDLRDEHTTNFSSSVSSDNLTSAAGGQAMGVSGPLTFQDTNGNSYTANVVATDSLADIQAKINAVGGLTASLVAVGSSANPTYQLSVTNNAGLDMTVTPDSGANTAVTGLGLMPSRSNAAADVSVNFSADQHASTFTGTSFSTAQTLANAGISGQLTFRDTTGTADSVTVTAGMGLNAIASAINGTSGYHAAVVQTGNQWALQVTDTAGHQMTVDGTPQTYQSTPTAAFAASAGKTLSATVNGTTYGPLTETAGDTLQTIAASINSGAGPFVGSGLKATVETDPTGTNSWISMVSTSGQPATFSGTMSTQLGITMNAATSLGMSAPPSQVTQGLSNFLGLNNLFSANQPAMTMSSKTLNNFVTSTPTTLNLSDASWSNGDPSDGNPQALTINLQSGMSLTAIAAQINAQAVTQDSSSSPVGTFSATAGTLNVTSNGITFPSITIPAGASLSAIASQINANSGMATAGVRAMVATNGTNEWLRVYSQQGATLQMGGSEVGSLPGQMSFSTNTVAQAAVVPDGSGQQLRITNNDSAALTATGTLVSQTSMGPSAVDTAGMMTVRSDIQNTPSLISRGAVQYNSLTNSFYVSSADGTTAQQMSQAMQNNIIIPSAGGLGQSSTTLAGFAAAIITANSTATATNTSDTTYQTQLNSNLNLQKSNISGVNMDQEVSNLMSYQQAYSAAAKVISTMETLFDVLDGIIK
ncbi:MAG TPA: flagellar hook-associated protein FlgK [Patescibacteria group bacterium]|nr:flagellar hook-associated protein FlgK [Patescibacteria group bacterium]